MGDRLMRIGTWAPITVTHSALLRRPNPTWQRLTTVPGVKIPGTGFLGGVSELRCARISGGISDHALDFYSRVILRVESLGRGSGHWAETGLPVLSYFHQTDPALCSDCLQGGKLGRELTFEEVCLQSVYPALNAKIQPEPKCRGECRQIQDHQSCVWSRSRPTRHPEVRK